LTELLIFYSAVLALTKLQYKPGRCLPNVLWRS